MADRHPKNAVMVVVMMAVAFDDNDALMIAVMVVVMMVFGDSHQACCVRVARRLVLLQRGHRIRYGRGQIGIR